MWLGYRAHMFVGREPSLPARRALHCVVVVVVGIYIYIYIDIDCTYIRHRARACEARSGRGCSPSEASSTISMTNDQ